MIYNHSPHYLSKVWATCTLPHTRDMSFSETSSGWILGNTSQFMISRWCYFMLHIMVTGIHPGMDPLSHHVTLFPLLMHLLAVSVLCSLKGMLMFGTCKVKFYCHTPYADITQLSMWALCQAFALRTTKATPWRITGTETCLATHSVWFWNVCWQWLSDKNTSLKMNEASIGNTLAHYKVCCDSQRKCLLSAELRGVFLSLWRVTLLKVHWY